MRSEEDIILTKLSGIPIFTLERDVEIIPVGVNNFNYFFRIDDIIIAVYPGRCNDYIVTANKDSDTHNESMRSGNVYFDLTEDDVDTFITKLELGHAL